MSGYARKASTSNKTMVVHAQTWSVTLVCLLLPCLEGCFVLGACSTVGSAYQKDHTNVPRGFLLEARFLHFRSDVASVCFFWRGLVCSELHCVADTCSTVAKDHTFDRFVGLFLAEKRFGLLCTCTASCHCFRFSFLYFRLAALQ